MARFTIKFNYEKGEQRKEDYETYDQVLSTLNLWSNKDLDGFKNISVMDNSTQNVVAVEFGCYGSFKILTLGDIVTPSGSTYHYIYSIKQINDEDNTAVLEWLNENREPVGRTKIFSIEGLEKLEK